MAKEKKGSGFLKVVVLVLLMLAGGAGYLAWKYAFSANVKVDGKNFVYLKIPKNTDYEELKEILSNESLINNIETFDWIARKMDLPNQIHPGRYRITPGMSNRHLVNLIRYGKEEKVTITINYTTRTMDQLSEKLVSKFDMDESELEDFLSDEEMLDREFGLSPVTIMTIVRPGTYELSWATSFEDYYEDIKKEYKKFWTDVRKQKARDLEMSQSEVMILASIVQGESSIESEQKKIAGVYLNRLAKNMALQADPTVIFALNDFTIRRVSRDDLQVESPYNTYRNKGLPPGPVCFPSDQAVSAVLNYEKSNYIFFCAKPELNGYSDFSCTLQEHEKFARAYRESLSKKGIKR